jgi:hypothetical protein
VGEVEDIPLFFTLIPVLALLSNYDRENCLINVGTEGRLRARSEDREDVIARRIREAAEEIRRYEDYDYVLINRELAEAEATLSVIVRAERCPANQNRRPDPAHFGHISSLR